MRVVDAGEPADVRLAVYSEKQVAELEQRADLAAGVNATADDRSIDPTSLDDTPLLWLLPASGEISLEAAEALGGDDARQRR